MIKIKKGFNVTAVFMLIGIFLCSDFIIVENIFALRVPLQEDEIIRGKIVGWLVEKGLLANGTRMPPELMKEIDEILADYEDRLPKEPEALRNLERRIEIMSQYATKKNSSLDLFSLGSMGLMLDSRAEKLFLYEPLEHVEEELWGVLRKILNYDQEIKRGAPNPYQDPCGYVDFMLDLMYEFWDLMKRDGRYRILVERGLLVCLKEHLKDVSEKRLDYPLSLRKGYVDEIVSMVNYAYRAIFDIYIDELINYESFLEHVEGSPYYLDLVCVSADHRDAVDTEEWKEQLGIRRYFASQKRGLSERLEALRKEAEILERISLWIQEGVIDPKKIDVEREILASHVVYGDPILRESYFRPSASNFYFKPLENLRKVRALGFIKRYLEDIIPGSPSILEIGSGCGTLGFFLDGSRLKKDLSGIEWNKMYVEEALKDKRGQYVKEGSVYSIPYRPKSFGAVISLESLDTVEDHERALEEISRVLDNDGLLVHMAIKSPNPETCKKILEEEGIHVFSDCFVGLGGRGEEIYSYSLDEEENRRSIKLRQDMVRLNRRDAQNAGIPYDDWPALSDRTVEKEGKTYGWSEEAKAKYQKVLEHRNAHMRLFDKETYRDILKRKSKGMFSFVEEREIDGVNFYVFRKTRVPRRRNTEL